MAQPDGAAARAGPGSASLLGLAVVFAADRLHKFAQIHIAGWHPGDAVTVTPFFDYVLVYNQGVSYGLLATLPASILIAVMAAAMLALVIWWQRTDSALTRWGLALALGGALGNITDRLVYGAVADFFSLHAMGYYFYIFNIADVGISLGLVLLVVEMFKPRARHG